MNRARLTWLPLCWAAAVAVASGSCEPIERYDAGIPPDGDDGGSDAGDAGPDGGEPDAGPDSGTIPATLTSFSPTSNLFIRAPLDGGVTYPNPLMVGVNRGSDLASRLLVEITSSDPAVVVAVGNGVDLPPGITTGLVELRTFSAGSATLTAQLAGGPTRTAAVTVLPTVVVSELGAALGSQPMDEFIELYNPTPVDFSIAGCAVQYRSISPGSVFQDLAVLPSGALIRAFSYYLVGFSPDYSGPVANATYSGASLSAGSGSVRFGAAGIGTSPTDVRTLDLIGWGTPLSFEGSPVASPGTWGSLERKAQPTATTASMTTGVDTLAGNAYDTNNNAADFVVRATREPQNRASPQENPP